MFHSLHADGPQAADVAFYEVLKARRARILGEYERLTPRSQALFERANRSFPGGFTRDAIHRAPHAPFVSVADGSQMVDVDGRSITDFWFNATALPLGHAHPEVVAAAQEQVGRGSAYFAPTERELALAEVLIDRLPCAERLRFTNSGSEAVMMAIRLARAFRRRELIVKCEGSYHGSYDDVSWSVGPSAKNAGQARPIADTAGLVEAENRVAVVPFNNVAALTRFFEEKQDDIAALLIEPVANRMGLLLPDPAFVAAARALCDRYDVVLIFDEVIAFRLGFHGAQGTLGVTPDLVTLGKVIGGGFPVGAVAGRSDILDRTAMDGAARVTHAGTFNGNPTTAAAGLATLNLLTAETIAALNVMGTRLRRSLEEITAGLPLCVTGAGSLFKITAAAGQIRDYGDAVGADKDWEALASLELLNRGFLLTTGLSGCVSTVTRVEEIDAFLAAFKDIVRV